MRYFLIVCVMLLCNSAFADTTQSRDGEGQKIQGASFGSIRSASIGTKGFKCFSTASKIAWEFKVTSGTDSTLIGYKYFYNNDESVTFPISDKMFQWQNAPTSKSPTITKACIRGYSSAVSKTAHGIFQ